MQPSGPQNEVPTSYSAESGQLEQQRVLPSVPEEMRAVRSAMRESRLAAERCALSVVASTLGVTVVVVVGQLGDSVVSGSRGTGSVLALVGFGFVTETGTERLLSASAVLCRDSGALFVVVV